MTAAIGSSQHAARVATGELARAGWTTLESLIGGKVAEFGDVCWMTDARLVEALPRRPNGRTYHPESAARARRKLRDAGIITSVRVFVGDKIHPKAKWRSSHGTTVKSFNWRAIAQKNPFSRRERRLHRQEQARKTREAGDVQPPRPRYASSRAIVEPVHMPTPVDPEMARLVARAQQYATRTPEREPDQFLGRSSAPERPPPD